MLLIRDITRSDYSTVEELLHANDLGSGRPYERDGLDVVVAELHGSVIGVAEFKLRCNFGHDEGREAHPGEQTFILTLAVKDTARRSGVGRALLVEIARRSQETGSSFLALVPQEGENATRRQAFFRACGLTLYGPDTPGAAWGCPLSKLLNADATSLGT
ncbi:GNAT family N-acetyltransferase [Streptomyces galbus]|uniref:GNAT family N-acetyltransferase n=1 Tax=Streptomyces galbus TaxID=33898 RepID=A0A4U5W492_STRGB|nr:GNAT family N-acetyltransferase [Streptomyces galbus]TKS96009.1 GNAT family N-acetyltransferase [Streptomyces galbus]GHD52040.1 hypothetical protein GCM10010335_63950 [Streptomyces galbus]